MLYLMLVLPLMLSSCVAVQKWSQDRWVYDYDTAERLVGERGCGMLIYFSDVRYGAHDPVDDFNRDPALQAQFKQYACCRLFKSHEPDRRYVAQFGVERAPAWIVVHPDGSFHARTGPVTAEGLGEFLAGATPPGETPRMNAHIPRMAAYQWYSDLGAARLAAESAARPTLVVYHRGFTSDWRMMSEILDKREVYSRAEGMVHCRIATWNPWTEAHISGFGPLRLPAVVVAHHDGRHEVLEKPVSAEAVARFLESARRPGEAPSEPVETPSDPQSGGDERAAADSRAP